jgi:hypothetical protein
MVEEGLRAQLAAAQPPQTGKAREIRWVTVDGGLPAGVDVVDRAGHARVAAQAGMIALTAFENGAREIWAHDGAFTTLAGLRVRDPLSP